MKTISFTGICPQCTLYDEQHFMRENGKFWECPNCKAIQLINLLTLMKIINLKMEVRMNI